VLSIEQCTLPCFLAAEPSFAGARAELASVRVRGARQGDRPSPIPERYRKIEAQAVHRERALVDAGEAGLADYREHWQSTLAMHSCLVMGGIALPLERFYVPT
jgi:hypothetical protein